MGGAAQVRAFSGADVRLIARDRFLWGMFGFLVVIALALRFAVPWVVDVVAEDALIVPASALLALAEGGFAVEVPAPDGTRLVGVDVGEVLDGRAEVSGRDIAEGGQVVIPS